MAQLLNQMSDLQRRRWTIDGLLQKQSYSFFAPYKGMDANSIVRVENINSAKDGHEVYIQVDGNLVNAPLRGKTTAFGTGEDKKVFQESVRVERYRFTVNNGDKFDSADLGATYLSEHEDSMSKLADIKVRWDDQYLFDIGQGWQGNAPSHMIDLGATFGYNDLLEIGEMIRTSTGLVQADGTTAATIRRRPLVPWRMGNGVSKYLFVIDSAMERLLMSDASFQDIYRSGDVRGNNNALINGMIGTVGPLVLVRAETFFGDTVNDNTGIGQSSGAATITSNETDVEICGLRQIDSAGRITGQPSFDNSSGAVHSRGFICGLNAFLVGNGQMPWYNIEYIDHKVRSESALICYTNAKKTTYEVEVDSDYSDGKVAGIDWGIIPVQVQVQS